MKRMLCLLVLAVCALALTACAAPAEPKEPVQAETAETAEVPEEITPQPGGQEAANSAYGQILESFGGLPPDDPGYPGYPEEFGDAYYRDGFLYICLTENTLEMREKYRALVDTPEILQFVEAAYSYNDLYALQTAVAGMMAELGLSSVGVNVEENRVDIGIPDIARAAEALAYITENLPADVAERFSEYPIFFEEEGFATTA